MIEPTESESKEELDRLCDALLSIREEITKIERGEWDKVNNPIKNAPHTQAVCISSDWNRPYPREAAAYPIVSLFLTYINDLIKLKDNYSFFFKSFIKPESKIWPTVGRVDDSYGDKNLLTKLDK